MCFPCIGRLNWSSTTHPSQSCPSLLHWTIDHLRLDHVHLPSRSTPGPAVASIRGGFTRINRLRWRWPRARARGRGRRRKRKPTDGARFALRNRRGAALRPALGPMPTRSRARVRTSCCVACSKGASRGCGVWQWAGECWRGQGRDAHGLRIWTVCNT